MMSIRKRAAGIGAAVALFATVGPVALASAATVPFTPSAVAAPLAPPALSGPVAGAYAAGTAAAVGGLNAGSIAAVGGWNAGAAAMGLPFSFTTTAVGPLGLQVPGVALPGMP